MMDSRIMPEGFGQGAWVGNTTLHPVGVLLLVVCLLFLFLNKKNFAFHPFFTLMCFVSPAQRIVIAGADFSFFRIYLLALCLRIVMGNEHRFFKLSKFDLLFFTYITIYVLVFMYSSSSISNPLGKFIDLLMLYFSVRCLLRTTEDAERLFRFLALLSIPVAFLFLVENLTGRNLFSVFGGVPELTKIRDGRLRCQGPFPHPIIAGCFWAILFPIFVGLYAKSKKSIYIIACIATTVIVFTTASSTTVFALISAPVFLLLYLVRQHVKKLFFMGLACLFVLHLVMNAPVWHLLSRVGAVGGSTSHFRYMLIDSFISHSHEWFFLGTNATGHWFFGAQDLTNQFVLVGVQSGILGLILFIALIWFFYANIGKAVRAGQNKAFIWGIGTAMSVSCVSFLGVSYFGQPVFLFYMLFPLSLNLFLYENYMRKRSARSIADLKN